MDRENQFPDQIFFGAGMFFRDDAGQCEFHLDGQYHHQDKREVIPQQGDMGGDEAPQALPHNENDRPQNPMDEENIPRTPQQQHIIMKQR